MEILLRPVNQRLTITVAGVAYGLALRWCEATEGGWVLDIADAAGAALVAGIPLITGADLLGQYGHLGLGFRLYIASDGDGFTVPSLEGLGSASRLYLVTDV
jgi:hypothetical protein